MSSHDASSSDVRPPSRRIGREQRTLAVMVHMYCRDMHGSVLEQPPGNAVPLCPSCAALLDYALERVRRCPFAQNKPTCARCTVHCFRGDMREQMRAVMRYSGPRMTLRHPYLALAHLLDRRRTPTDRSPRPEPDDKPEYEHQNRPGWASDASYTTAPADHVTPSHPLL